MSKELINGCYKGVEFKYREDTEPEIKSFDENYLHKCETCTDLIIEHTDEDGRQGIFAAEENSRHAINLLNMPGQARILNKIPAILVYNDDRFAAAAITAHFEGINEVRLET